MSPGYYKTCRASNNAIAFIPIYFYSFAFIIHPLLEFLDRGIESKGARHLLVQ